jgi:hypothetical protein
MRCIAYIWNSADCKGSNFLLCLTPLDTLEGGVTTEAFSNETNLSQRLADIGLCPSCIVANLHHLKKQRDSTLANIEVSQRAFDGFRWRQRADEDSRR